jgi:hypothetical protein
MVLDGLCQVRRDHQAEDAEHAMEDDGVGLVSSLIRSAREGLEALHPAPEPEPSKPRVLRSSGLIV